MDNDVGRLFKIIKICRYCPVNLHAGTGLIPVNRKKGRCRGAIVEKLYHRGRTSSCGFLDDKHQPSWCIIPNNNLQVLTREEEDSFKSWRALSGKNFSYLELNVGKGHPFPTIESAMNSRLEWNGLNSKMYTFSCVGS